MTNNMKKLLPYLLITAGINSFGQPTQKKDPAAFVPKGFVVAEKIQGDLNKDGVNDCVLLIKATDKKQIIKDEYRGELDRNRRGIIVLFSKNDQYYEQAMKNYTCFSSENEDGGVYYAPELSIEIGKGNLLISYAHGRYGGWKYSFRYQNGDFDLIGYDASYQNDFNTDYVTFDEESINFLTKKKLTREVIKVDADGKESYKDSWKNIVLIKRIKLSEITDFDELYIAEMLKEKDDR
jgi:hypothetical protein